MIFRQNEHTLQSEHRHTKNRTFILKFHDKKLEIPSIYAENKVIVIVQYFSVIRGVGVP